VTSWFRNWTAAPHACPQVVPSLTDAISTRSGLSAIINAGAAFAGECVLAWRLASEACAITTEVDIRATASSTAGTPRVSPHVSRKAVERRGLPERRHRETDPGCNANLFDCGDRARDVQVR
jgi:hypothetical protein